MKHFEVAKHRGEIIERFVGLEQMLNLIISQYYLSKISKEFVFDFLNDDYMNFGVKMNALENILQKRKLDISIISDMRRANKIRNVFSHSVTKIKTHPSQDSEATFIHYDGDIIDRGDLDVLYKEFVQKQENLSVKLFEISKEMGVKWKTE
jgi:hypothetical protein